MNWLFQLHATQPVAHAIGVLLYPLTMLLRILCAQVLTLTLIR